MRRPPRAATDFALGSVGAGLGATTVDLKGGLGSASAQTRDGITVGALAVVNAVGSAVIGGGPHFWAAPYERDGEFGGRGLPVIRAAASARLQDQGPARREHHAGRRRHRRGLDQGAGAASRHHGAGRHGAGAAAGPYPARRRHRVCRRNRRAAACRPGHSRCRELGALAADVVARAIARGVYEARALPFPGALPALARPLQRSLSKRSDPTHTLGGSRLGGRRMPSASAISMAKSLQL